MEVNHCEVGRLIIKSWNLGPAMEDVVFFHHFLDSYPGTNRDVLLTVAAANFFANTAQIGSLGRSISREAPTGLFDELGISRDDLEDIEDTVNGEIEKAKVFLRSPSRSDPVAIR